MHQLEGNVMQFLLYAKTLRYVICQVKCSSVVSYEQTNDLGQLNPARFRLLPINF